LTDCQFRGFYPAKALSGTPVKSDNLKIRHDNAETVPDMIYVGIIYL